MNEFHFGIQRGVMTGFEWTYMYFVTYVLN